MPLSNASRLADFGTGIGTAGAIIQVDNVNQRLGVGTTAPTATLGVAGIVSATAFYGDGSNLDGVASAGLGTALSETEFDPLTVIYQTSDTLSVGATITVDPPDATTKVAYTQYADIKLEDDADLIIADGDDFIPDILGLSTEGFSFSNANGNGVFDTVYTDNIENAAGRGAPNFPLGITVSGISTLSGNVTIGGTLTYEDVTNVDSIGVVTARNGIDITGASAGLNASSNLRLKTAGAERVNITSTGLGIGVNNPSQILEVQGGSAAKPTFKHSAGWGALRVAGSAGGSGSGFILANNYNGTIEEKWSIYLDGSNDGLRFTAGPPETTSAERLRIGSAGQIGLSGANYGTSGQVMTSQGASAAPQWATPSSGGLVHVEGFTAPNTQYITFDNLTATNVSYYQIKWSGINFNESNYNSRLLQAELQFNGTWNNSSTPYLVRYDYHDMGGGGQTVYTDGSNFIKMNVNGSYIVNGELNIPMQIANGGGTSATKFFTGLVYGGSPNIMKYELYGKSDNAAARGNTLTGVRFFSSTSSDKIGMVGRMDLYKYVF